MINTISWQAYWQVIVVALVIYYVVVVFRFFVRNSILSSGSATAITGSPISTSDGLLRDSGVHSEFHQPEMGSEEQLVYSCIDELNAFLQQSKRTKCDKPSFLFSIKRILTKYPSLKTSQYKEAVSSVLASEAEHLCSIHIDREDVDSVWLGV